MSLAELPAIDRLNPEDNGLLMTPAEFDAVEDWDRDDVFELVQGVVIVSPAPVPHGRNPNDVLGHWVQTYQESHPNGSCVDETLPERDIAVANGRRLADRIWVGLGRIPNVDRGTPQIVIEFVSERRHDRGRDDVTKWREYREAGVLEYWKIDRTDRSVSVFTRDSQEKYNETRIVRSPLPPGFERSVAELMKATDRDHPSTTA